MTPLLAITIIGGGSWATALVKIFSESGIHVTWHLRSEEHVRYLVAHGRNPNYLSSLTLDMQYIRATHSLQEAIEATEDILFAVPSAYLESSLSGLDESALTGKRIYLYIKGLVTDAFILPSVFLASRFHIDARHITVIAGPCHAEEIAMGRKTYLTVSGELKPVVKRMASAIGAHYVQVVTNGDPIGTEYSAILKNVFGIASGIVRGLNYGDNFLAVVVSNAMREADTFLQALDHKKRNLFDSAYFGDLLVTAYSEFSRNRNFGLMLGRGYTVPDAELRMSMVAEGYPAAKGMYLAAKNRSIQMPVAQTVYRILYEHAAPYAEFKLLEKNLK